MDGGTAVKLLGGLGMFLLGIHHLTEGLKGLAGDSLRRALQRIVSGRFSAVAAGALFTAIIQSSSAATLTVIGFVSAGLLTFAQSVAVIVGATLGTTATPWLVALFGFRVSVSAAALPILGVGAFLWLIAAGKARSFGAILAGFGLIFTGIEYLQNGMAGVEWNLAALAGTGPGAKWILAAVGIVMTIVMQSSSAAAATTLVALHAGSLTFEQGCAMIVGQSIGTTGTTALTMIGGGIAVRRAALAHIVFSVIVGVLGMVFLAPLTTAAAALGTWLDDPDGVMALAVFSSIFKLAGIVAFYPWLDRFAALVERFTGGGTTSAVGYLEPTLAAAGGGVALEAAWRALLEVALGTVDAVRRRLAGEPAPYTPPVEQVGQIEQFLESLSLETTDLSTVGPRLVRLCHALDHLATLHEDLTRFAAPPSGWRPPAASAAGATALAAWCDAARDPERLREIGDFAALEAASHELTAARRTGRAQILEDVALGRTATATARGELDSLLWADAALYHAWRLLDSLRVAGGG